jgi:hypothetical protein
MYSKKSCQQILAIWKKDNWEHWFGKDIQNPLDHIKEFWDGGKLRLYQRFWNPDLKWKLPVSCTNEKWKMEF